MKLYINRGLLGKHCCLSVLLIFGLLAQPSAVTARAIMQTYQSDDWVTECETDPATSAPDCSIVVTFDDSVNGKKGIFALFVTLQIGALGIVGQPFPLQAMLRVDQNLPIECKGERYCLFPRDQSLPVIRQLTVGSLILLDVVTTTATFKFSVTPKGFQAGLSEIRAWGYGLSGE
jgi:hypothetical protein